MKIETFIGIDPGQGGGIASYSERSGLKVVKMPDDQAMIDYFKYLKETSRNPMVFVERVSAFGSDTDVQDGKRFRIDVMLANFAKLKILLLQAGLPYVQVSPAVWQKTLNLRLAGEEKKERKERYKRAASKYFPQLKATLWNADAVCILQFGIHKYHSEPNWIIEKLPANLQQKLI